MFFYAVESFEENDLLGSGRRAFGNKRNDKDSSLQPRTAYGMTGSFKSFQTLTERMNFMYSIDLQSRTPIYEQLYKKIIELILKRELMPNDKLPSVRELAKELGINPNTVSKAFQLLERDKVIYSLAGRGSFVANVNAEAVKDAALADFDKAVSEALNAGIGKSELTERIRCADVHGSGDVKS